MGKYVTEKGNIYRVTNAHGRPASPWYHGIKGARQRAKELNERTGKKYFIIKRISGVI